MADKPTIGDMIRTARESKGLSLSDAAKRIGVSKGYLWEIEAGRFTNPTISVAAGMRRVLGLSAKKLLDAAIDAAGEQS